MPFEIDQKVGLFLLNIGEFVNQSPKYVKIKNYVSRLPTT